MKLKFYLLKTLLFASGIISGAFAQTISLTKTVNNISTGLSGVNAMQNHILEYVIVVTNQSASNVTSSKIYDNIPAGVVYLAGTTRLNSNPVADVSGKMPFSNSGGLVNSLGYGPGILAPNVNATITFRVRVRANAGSVTNYATLEGKYGSKNFTQNTNSVFSNIAIDAACNYIYESTTNRANACPSGCPGGAAKYRQLRRLFPIGHPLEGQSDGIIYDGATGLSYEAITNDPTVEKALLYASALGYDKASGRIYFINNILNDPPEDLCYIDLNTTPVVAKRYVGKPLETNTGSGYNINRMCFSSDGNGYAVTSNGRDFIRFTIDPATNLPIITRMGTLINATNNGSHNILAETGGDIFADGSGNIYLIANSSGLYKINPTTRVATYLGTITPTPPDDSNSIAIDANGTVFIGGAYNQVYTISLTTMQSTLLASSTGISGVFTSGDFTSCAFPVLAPALTVGKTSANINGSPIVVGGDTVEYTITITNTGNINAANVKLYDSIPGTTDYVAGSTRMNGTPIADVMGKMPFSVVGGRLVNSAVEAIGIVKPGVAHRVVVKFRVKVDPLHLICNQSRITLTDEDGNTIFVNSDDPLSGGSQNPTCFFSDGVLPLNNLQFRGSLNEEYSVLRWAGTEDANLNAYEIQFSENGLHFITLDTVAAKPAEGYNNSYQYTDMKNAVSGNRFYRLKLIQKGGSQSYSGAIRLNVKGIDAQVQPNPFDKELNLQFQLKTAETVRIRLVDTYGRVVYTTTEKLSVGTHSLSLPIPSNIRTGMYVLEMSSGNRQLYQKKLLKL